MDRNSLPNTTISSGQSNRGMLNLARQRAEEHLSNTARRSVNIRFALGSIRDRKLDGFKGWRAAAASHNLGRKSKKTTTRTATEDAYPIMDMSKPTKRSLPENFD